MILKRLERIFQNTCINFLENFIFMVIKNLFICIHGDMDDFSLSKGVLIKLLKNNCNLQQISNYKFCLLLIYHFFKPLIHSASIFTLILSKLIE